MTGDNVPVFPVRAGDGTLEAPGSVARPGRLLSPRVERGQVGRQDVVDALVGKIHNMGTDIFEDSVADSTVSTVHYSKNFILTKM